MDERVTEMLMEITKELILGYIEGMRKLLKYLKG
jgi:hypothetical protein